jgi:hypothetical protein
MTCCKERRAALATINDDIYQGQFSLFHPYNIKFYITGDGALTTIDTNIITCDYFRCANCSNTHYSQLYIRPTLYVTLDGKTKYPVKAHRKMLNLVGFAFGHIYSEPNFGTFIGGWYWSKNIVIKYIVYCPIKTIHKIDDSTPTFKIDDKISMCFITQDNEIILINSDCEIIETVCVLESEPGIFRLPGGYLEYTGGDFIIDFYKIVWSYKADPALKTKPALASQEA